MAAKLTIRNFQDIQISDYSECDITTIYDVLIKQDFDELCDFCLKTELFKPKVRILGGHAAMLNYFSSFKRLLVAIGPDYDHSADEVIVPWDGVSLQNLCTRPWSEVLGRRILFPSAMSAQQRMFCILLIMFAMSYIHTV